MEENNKEEYNSMVNTNTMLLSFEGWIKYIEGFSRGLQTTKTVDAVSVLECVGEIMEFMKQLKGQIVDILVHCENVLEKEDLCNQKIEDLEKHTQTLINKNKNLEEDKNKLQEELDNYKQENEKLIQAIKLIEEKQHGKV